MKYRHDDHTWTSSRKMTMSGFVMVWITLASGCMPVGSIGSKGNVSSSPAISVNSSTDKGGYSLAPYLTKGQLDPGHPAVGPLPRENGKCTATLIGKRTVITAGHCVDGNGLQFLVGPGTYNVAQIIVHPQYGGGKKNDLALVILDQEPVGVLPSPIAIEAPKVNDSIVLVGFGITKEMAQDWGTKRAGSNTVTAVNSTTFEFLGGTNVCNGDSGGPTFAMINGQEVVVGIHSTKSGVCGSGGTDMRVDAYRDWIVNSTRGDVVLASPNGPAAVDNGIPAGEGESCANRVCQGHLTCTEIFGAGYTKALGKYCLERCTNLGQDSACDGQEFCTQSRSAGLVCFNPANAQGGFCSNGVVPSTQPPEQPGQPNPPQNPPQNPPAEPTGPTGECGGLEESEAFKLLNMERAQNGLGQVQCDEVGLAAARAHSQDMCDRGYFDHTSPDGSQPWDRLNAAGAQFGTAGENIAAGYSSPSDVHQGWMESDGHRENILTPYWGRAAIGMINCQNDGMPYWTEVFMD